MHDVGVNSNVKDGLGDTDMSVWDNWLTQYLSLAQDTAVEEAEGVVPGDVLELSILAFSFCGILKLLQKVR